MPMWNLKEYSDNYWKIFGTLCQKYRDVLVLTDADIITDFIINYESGSFKFQQKLRDQKNCCDTKDVEIMVPIKYIQNFLRTLEMPFANNEINPSLTWSSNCVIAFFTNSN